MKRKLSTKIYILAFIITAAIFVFGILLGLLIDTQRSNYIENQYRAEQINFLSSTLQYEFIENLDENKSCIAIYKTFYDNLVRLESARLRLEEQYGKNSVINQEDFDYLKREYLLAEVQYWLLAEQSKKFCDNDVVTVLYFYSDEKECPYCSDQAFILNYLKKRFGDRLLIFSFNGKYEEEPVVPLLKTVFGVYEYPTLILDGVAMHGLTGKDALTEHICSQFEKPVPECSSS